MAHPMQAVPMSQKGEQTLADRLNAVSNTLHCQLDRIDSVLSRVNSTPRDAQVKDSAPVPHFGMAEVVQRMEDQVKKLASLGEGLERIA